MNQETRNLAILGSLVLVLLVALFFADSSSSDQEFDLLEGKGTAAVVQLEGTISSSSGRFGSSSITPSQVKDLNERALNSGADAVIYEINSGGGAVVASKDVMRSINSVDVPTVCRFRDVAASGAYLVSLGCDRTVADSASVTGSIGVRSSYLEYSGLMKKLGVEYVNITSGRLKEAGVPYENVTKEERNLLKDKADIVHQEFLSIVESERGLNSSQREDISSGEFFLGTEAERLDLVDHLGGRQKAISVAENLTGNDLESNVIESRESLGIFELLGMNAFSGDSSVLEAKINY